MRPCEVKYRIEQQNAMSSHLQFKGSEQPVICSLFGCRQPLTLMEQLAGSKCTGCMKPHDRTFKHYKL